MASETRAPDTPTDVSAQGWKQTLKRTVKEFQDDNLIDWAAALTYYAMLALFPGIIVLVSILALAGQQPETTDALLRIVGEVGPASAVETFRGPIENIVSNQATAGTLLGVGLLAALWAASGYVGAFFRASSAVWDVEEGRSVWKLIPLRMVTTIVVIILLALVLIALVITGPLARAVGSVIGVGDTAVSLWQIAKWPVMLTVVVGIIGLLYYIAPNVQHPKVNWVSPGGIVAVLAWIVASAGFAFYVANFGSYNETYGALGGVIVLLLWLWISNLALLFGAELNAELERGRQIAKGVPPDKEPYLPPRQAADDT